MSSVTRGGQKENTFVCVNSNITTNVFSLGMALRGGIMAHVHKYIYIWPTTYNLHDAFNDIF